MKASKYKAANKDEKCNRCDDRLPQYEATWEEDGRSFTQKVCLPCYQLMRTENDRKPSGKGELCVIDYVKYSTTQLVTRFVEDKLKKFSFALDEHPVTVYLCLKQSLLHDGDVLVKHRIPKRPRGNKKWSQWMEGRVLVRRELVYPHEKRVAIATCQVKDKVSLALGCDKWWYEYADITFADQAEAFAYGAGSACFKLLRKMSLVPGLASKVGCTKAAVQWLEEFRVWRAGQKKPSEKPMAFVNA